MSPRPRSRFAKLLAATLLAGALLGAAPAAAQAAAPAGQTVATEATAHVREDFPSPTGGRQAPNHAIVGTWVNFANDTNHQLTFTNHADGSLTVIPPGATRSVHGAVYLRPDLDGFLNGMPFTGDNPSVKTASLTLGFHHVTGNQFVNSSLGPAQVHFQGTNAKKIGGHYKGFKEWTVKFTTGWDYTFIHHTSEDDGVKGLVVNQTDTPQTLEMGGGRTVLKPGQRMLFYDAHKINDGRGTFMRIYAPNTGMYDINLIDPYTGWPRSEASLDGRHHTHKYSEGETATLPMNNGYRLQIHRHHDGALSQYETDATGDWAKFTITINNR